MSSAAAICCPAVLSIPSILLVRIREKDPGGIGCSPLRFAFNGVLSSLASVDASALLVCCRLLARSLSPELLTQWREVAADVLAVASDDGILRVFRVEQGGAGPTFPHPGPITLCAWSPCGSVLATGGDDCSLRFVRVEAGGPMPEILHNGRLGFVEWSPSGELIASSCETEDCLLRIIDVATGSLRVSVDHGKMVAALGWSSCGSRIVTVCEQRVQALGSQVTADTKLNVIDATSGCVWQLDHGSPIVSLAFSPEPPLVATGTEDGLIRIVDCASQVVLQIVPLSGRIRPLLWDPSGAKRLVAVCCGGSLGSENGIGHDEQWSCIHSVNVESGVVEWKFNLQKRVSPLRWSPNGKFIAMACHREADVWLLDPSSGCVSHIIRQSGAAVYFAWSPAGDVLATIEPCCADGVHLRLVEASSGRLLHEFKRPEHVEHSSFSGEVISWSPSGRFLAVVWCYDLDEEYSELVRVFSVSSGKLRLQFHCDDHVRALSWRP
mmetsp:Transcript_158794/g.505583  ORF Transcript_158794/g.505583 Transcript_158794/m.505583 type:complete len:495 (-) Transcript_158794:556-2040(-)